MIFEIKNKSGETVAVESDFGNAAEHEMVLSECIQTRNLPLLK